MINHARNLLVNCSGNDFSRIGEEIVDPQFRPVSVVRMPSAVVVIRSVLFGSNPDCELLNYRAAQFLRLLHSCELAEYVLALDPRITYDTTDTELFSSSLFEPSVEIVATAGAQLILAGAAENRTQNISRLQQRWSISLTDVSAGTASLSLQLFGTPVHSTTATASVGAGSSSTLFSLPGSTLQARLLWPDGDSETATTGLWYVNSRLRPSSDFSLLETRLHQFDEALVDIFSRGSQQGYTEPFATFYDLWTKSPYLEYRLGGLLLALVYKMNEL